MKRTYYIPNRNTAGATDDISIQIFERIAKEGRKYGVSLVVVTQRPSAVNKTILSQCSNFVAMRLTNFSINIKNTLFT
jgi:hypothetical protein